MKYTKITPYLLLFGCLTGLSSCQKKIQKADLIISNATIWTGNDQQPEAESIAIVSDSIIGVGTTQEMEKFQGRETLVIDAKGQFIAPGFIDTHVHLIGGGNGLLSVILRDANTPEEFIQRIAAYAQSIEPKAWILEGNWDHMLWGGELPQKEWIDKYTENNPVAVYRLDGHMLLANSAALAWAGINKHTPDVMGGKIMRRKNGTPTGILKDNAMNLLLDKIPPLTDIQKENALKAATKYFLSHGVTSIHDMDGLRDNPGSYAVAQRLRDTDSLFIRIYAMQALEQWKQLLAMNRQDDKWLKTGGLKGFVDGSLGSHTAAFKEAYTDQAGYKGFFINTKENLYQWISGADKANFKVMTHAIGDSAVHFLLNMYERITKENGPKDRRFRIEHAQHILPENINRFAELQVIASMQPYHAIDDGRWAEKLIGAERIKTTYPFRSLLDANAIVVFGSDWPVAPTSPLAGIYAAVTRRTGDGKNPDGWVPEQKITVEEALTAYTKNAAYASFEENLKGTLEPGKLADFIIVNKDPRKVDPVRIKDLQVLQTYIGGKKVFDYQKD